MIGSFLNRCKFSSKILGRRPSRRLRFEELESRLAPSVNVLTYRNDIASTGLNANETQLTPSNVNVSSFGKLFATPVDGQVYAEPLIDTGITITSGSNTRAGAAGVHDVVFVATEHDSLYAIDASAAGGAILWQRTFLDASNPTGDINNTLGATAIGTVPTGDVGALEISPEIGITGTPVIDPNTNLLYVVVKTKETIAGGAHYVQRLHAINISDGTDATAPALIGDTTNGNTNSTQVYVYGSGDGNVPDPYSGTGKPVVQFNALRELQRGALSLVNNEVYVDWASHGDVGPYHGWIVAWDVSTVKTSGFQMKGVFNASPNDGLAGIWESGGALAFEADGSAFYFETGNGSGGPPTLNANGFPTNANYNEALVKMEADPTTSPTNQNPNGWGLKVVDYFIPYNVAALDGADSDFGSGAPLILPDSAGIPGHPHLLVASGKEGKIYLVDRDNLGHFNAANDNVLNAVPDGSGHNTPPVQVGGALSSAAYFSGRIYWVGGYSSTANAYVVNSNGTLSITSQTSIATFGQLPGSVAVSANGTSSGIVWVMDRSAIEIHAYDATTFATELWNSGQRAGGADNLGTVIKFASPTIANGEVYVGTSDSLVVYGLTRQPNAVPAAPVLKATPLSGSSINLTWTDSTVAPNTASGYDIEQSTDNLNFTQVATAPAGATSIAVGSLSPQTSYYFRIRGFNSLGDSNYSNTASATTTGQVAGLDFSGGFAGSSTQLTFNGSAAINGTKAELTNGGQNEAGTFFSTDSVDVTRLTTQFTFQLSAGAGTADGFTFCIQGNGPTALGAAGGGLGYHGLPNSVAIKFDLFNDQGEGVDSTGLYTNGTYPGSPGSIDLTSTGIDLHSGDIFQVNVSYSGVTLSVTITDTVTGKSATQNYTVNIPAIAGNNAAYVGFTGATSSLTATQDILTWTYSANAPTSPNAPSGLGASPASADSVNLTWINNATNQTGFHLDRATDSGFTMNLLTENLPANTTSFTDTAAGLAPGGTYYYRIRAYNSAGDSGNSNVASAAIPLAPPAPTNQQVTNVTTSEIDLSWQDNAGRQTNGYKILRSAGGGSFSQVASLPPTSRTAPSTYTWADTNLAPGTSYEYHIIAYNVSGNNGFADIRATTITLPPSGVSATAGNAMVILSWTAPAGAQTYNVYRGTTSGKEVLLATGLAAASYNDSAVTNGTTYFYTVTAVNANAGVVPVIPGESAASSEVQATPSAPKSSTTTTTVSVSANPSAFGQSVMFTATVSPQIGGGTPAGSVQFVIDNGSPVTMSLSGGGTATYTTLSLSVGKHTVTASYSGDSTFAGSNSTTLTQMVNPAGTTTLLTATPNPSLAGYHVVFTATITVPGPGTTASANPTGTVIFFDGTTKIGQATVNSNSNGAITASFGLASLSAGTHSITASYSGDNNFAASTSNSLIQTVNGTSTVATSTQLGSSVNPSMFGQTVVFTATITASGGSGTPSGTVQFAIDGRGFGSPVSVSGSGGVSTASFNTASLTAGTHTITASYSGDNNFAASTSNGLIQTVNGTSTVATSTQLGSSANPSMFGQTVVFTATITASGGSGTPSGTVQFAIDGRGFGSPVSVSGSSGVSTASFSTASLAVGTHTITASYSGDTSFAGSSASFTQSVNHASTNTVVTSSANPSGLGQAVTFMATISSQSPGAGTPTGTVQFQMDGSALGTPVTVGGSGGVAVASFTITLSAAGTHAITANYGGDANFTTSSGSFTQTVRSGTTSTANVTVMLDSATGVLDITGDSGSDAFTVTQSSPGLLQIAGVNTLINQSSSPATYALGSVSAIEVSLLNGNDSVSMNNFRIAGTLSITAGSGTDTITLDTLTANLLSLSAAGPATDTLTLDNLSLGSATVTAGANATLAVLGLSSAGTVQLTAGSNATVSVNNLTALGDLDITVGDNTQAVTVKGSSAYNLNIRQTGSTGSPLFDLEYDTLNNVTLRAGAGNNRLVFSHLRVAVELLVYLGAGNNTLTADHVTALFGYIDGGPGGNNGYTDGGGNQGLVVVNFIPG